MMATNIAQAVQILRDIIGEDLDLGGEFLPTFGGGSVRPEGTSVFELLVEAVELLSLNLPVRGVDVPELPEGWRG